MHTGAEGTMFCVANTDTRFRAPFGAVVCGPTMSGKSHYVFKLIKYADLMISKPVQRIVYCYGAWQPAFDDLKNIELIRGVDRLLSSEDFFDPKQHTLLILDDLADEISKSSKASKLFTQGIHHLNVSVIFITQNLYKQGKSMRDIHLNCQYLVLFRNCRDVNQIKTLSRQMGLPHLPEAYERATSEQYEPLVIDMQSNTPNYLRLRSHIMPDQYTRLYVKDSLPCRKACEN